ncbi:MAG: hypothetical protein ABJP45_09335 [Cyclobacteriaceae bacterium]
MKIYEDLSKNLSDFIKVNVKVNQGNPNYIRPWDHDIKAVFDSDKNKLLKKGKVRRWLVKNDSGELIGRIAAFVNPRYKNIGDRYKMGGVGFFDSTDDQEVANLLFDTAKEWLSEYGMEAMDGPINFGDRDRWWGLLVEGFHAPPYALNYNPPYYQKLFESYGFKNFYNQICWKMVLSDDAQLSDKFYTAHKRFADNPEFSARHYEKSELTKFAQDFCDVYNGAWASHKGNKSMALAQAEMMFKKMAPIIDGRIVWFAYHKGKPVAMWINIPDINQMVKHLNGKFNLKAKIHFMILKWRKVCNGIVGVVFGVIPEHQGTGIDYYMIVEGEKEIKTNTPYRELELQWQGDFNPKILNISKNLDAEKARTLVTYRYIFDRDAPFERHPIL